MANIKSAEKRVRQTATRSLRNKATKTRVKSARKAAVSPIHPPGSDPVVRSMIGSRPTIAPMACASSATPASRSRG